MWMRERERKKIEREIEGDDLVACADPEYKTLKSASIPHLSSMSLCCILPSKHPRHPSLDPPSTFSHAQPGSWCYSRGYPEVPHDHAWTKSKGRKWLDVDSHHSNCCQREDRERVGREVERERERQHTWDSKERGLYCPISVEQNTWQIQTKTLK